MTIDYTIIAGDVYWHLTDEDGDTLLTSLDRSEFVENCFLMFGVVL